MRYAAGLLSVLVLSFMICWSGAASIYAAALSSGKDYGAVPALKAVERSSRLSSLFVRLSDGAVLYERGARELLIPASLVKLITAATALDHWGGHHRFRTSAWTDKLSRASSASSGQGGGPQAGAVVLQNLYLRGGGDPSLVNEKLWELANALKNMGVRAVSGDLILDQSLFSVAHHPYLRRKVRSTSAHAYDAPLAPLAVNFSTYELWVKSALAAPSRSEVVLLPYARPGVRVVDETKVKAHGSERLKVVRKYHASSRTLSLEARGHLQESAPGAEQNPRRFYRSAVDASAFAGELIRAFLKKEGIVVRGTVRVGTLPPSPIHLYTLPGYEISRLIRGMNTYSNNFIADMLALNLGLSEADQDSAQQWQRSLDMLQSYTQSSIGYFPQGAQIVNGSGLQGAHRLSADMVVGLLYAAFRDLKVFPDFIASLAVPGENGTLKSRFKKLPDIRAKTGSLSQPVVVCSLAGYGTHSRHGLYAFAMIHNGLPSGALSLGDFYQVQERALQQILLSWNETSSELPRH